MEQNNQKRRSYSNWENTSQNQDYYNQRNSSYRDYENDDDYENKGRDFQNSGDQYRGYSDYNDRRNSGQGYNRNSNINEDNRNRNSDYGRNDRYRNQDFSRGYGNNRNSYQRDNDSDYGSYTSRGVYGEGGYGYNPYGDDYNRRQDYGRYNQSQDYGRNRNYDYENRGNENDRNWWNRTRDEVSSWFGDDEAQRRREQDDRNSYRGKGPKDYKRSEERIREDVSDRLCDAYDVDASEIEVKISGSEVTLSGRVNTKSEKRRAEDIAEQVSGVTNVQNNLRVGSWNDTGSATNTNAERNSKTGSTSAAS